MKSIILQHKYNVVKTKEITKSKKAPTDFIFTF